MRGYPLLRVHRPEATFAWRDGKPALCPHFWVGDRVVRGRDAPGPVVDLLADIGDESTVAAGSLAPFLAVSSTTFSTVV